MFSERHPEPRLNTAALTPVFLLLMMCIPLLSFGQTQVRIRDIAVIKGMRENQLVGFGIVTGLSGKGDSDRSVLLRQALSELIAGHGMPVTPEEIRSRNSAVVMVTAEAPSFLTAGSRIPVQVSSLGDAKQLSGGVLLPVALEDLEGSLTAHAQGRVVVSGGGSAGGGNSGVVPYGAILERDIGGDDIAPEGVVAVILRIPDFTMASRIAEAVREEFPDADVRSMNGAEVRVRLSGDEAGDPVAAIARIESLTLQADSASRVVVDPATGIVVMGGSVRIGTVSVSWKQTRIRVGDPATHGRSGNGSSEHFSIPESPTVEDFVALLREAGIPPEALVDILRAIEAAGALYGTLVVL